MVPARSFAASLFARTNHGWRLVERVPSRLLWTGSSQLAGKVGPFCFGASRSPVRDPVEPGTPQLLGREHSAMAAPQDRPGDSSSESPSPETSTRRLREESQIDFEIEFLGRILEREPLFVEALRVHADNLAKKGQYGRALQIDRRLVRLAPEDAIVWYNLACSFAMLGMLEPAFSALQKALELGYNATRRLRRDPDLKLLRGDPRFARLLRRFGIVVT